MIYCQQTTAREIFGNHYLPVAYLSMDASTKLTIMIATSATLYID
jgi:hypothetical protein